MREKITACRNCFRINVNTDDCTCDHFEYISPQTLRLVGSSAGPLWYIDIQIFDHSFPAMINTSIFKCRINHQMSVWLQMTSNGVVDKEATEISVPVSRKDGRVADVHCDINKPQVELIELGQQYLKYAGYTLTVGEDTIRSHNSPIANDSQEVNYAYNLPLCTDLRIHLNKNKRFLKQRRIAKLPNWPQQADSRKIVVQKRRRSSQDSEESS